MAERRSNFSFHEGNALITLAGTYPTLGDVIYEAVQNALDSNATTVWITLNYARRTLHIRDNGDGVTQVKFERALSSVCHTIKKDDALGRFGIGLISPLGKCKSFTFTSTPKRNARDFLRWTFVTDNLREQQKVSGIPMSEMEDLIYGFAAAPQRGTTQVNWRTEVALTDIVRDATVTRVRVEEVSSGIVTRFGERMRKLGTAVFVKTISADGAESLQEVTAPQFTGTPLKQQRYEGAQCGRTVMRLYIAPKTSKGRRGKVSIGMLHNDFRVSLSDFVRQHGELVSSEIREILSSGIFEGHILSERCELLPNRRGFAETDALVEFITHIERWIQEVGAGHVSAATDTERDERYQALGIRSIKTIETMLEREEFADLLTVVKSFMMGTIGTGHTHFGTIYGEQEKSSVATRGGARKNRQARRDEQFGRVPRNGTPEHRPGHTPTTVAGPLGTKRRVVRGHSTGLQFCYEEMPGESVLWKLDAVHGVLSFNVRHPLWERAEKSDRVLMRFQESIAMSALTLELMPAVSREACRAFVDAELSGMLFLIEAEHPLARVRLGAKPKPKKEKKAAT